MNKENSNIKFLCMVICSLGALACFIGMFLPYIKISLFGANMEVSLKDAVVNTVENKGEIPYLGVIFLAAGIGFVFSLDNQFLLCGIMGAVCITIERIFTRDLWESYTESSKGLSGFEKILYESMISKGAGFYCIIVGSCIMIFFGVIGEFMWYKSKQITVS